MNTILLSDITPEKYSNGGAILISFKLWTLSMKNVKYPNGLII